MTIEVLNRFRELLTRRCEDVPLLNIGEDSIRYDFFCALSQICQLNPWEVQLEYPINRQAFNLRNHPNSKRFEKPMLDLVVNTETMNLCAEFGLFRQNSNDNGNINPTEKTVKMMMDMIRLGLESNFSIGRHCYFICVADAKMLGHQLKSRILGRFPSSYHITIDTITQQRLKKTSNFDERFVAKLMELHATINANLIFNEEIQANRIRIETRVLVWEVSLIPNL